MLYYNTIGQALLDAGESMKLLADSKDALVSGHAHIVYTLLQLIITIVG